jgi:hypothetical protein
MGGASPENAILGSLLKNRQLLFLARTTRLRRLRETNPTLPVVIGRERNHIGGASPENPILGSFRKNRQFLFLAETIRSTGLRRLVKPILRFQL